MVTTAMSVKSLTADRQQVLLKPSWQDTEFKNNLKQNLASSSDDSLMIIGWINGQVHATVVEIPLPR